MDVISHNQCLSIEHVGAWHPPGIPGDIQLAEEAGADDEQKGHRNEAYANHGHYARQPKPLFDSVRLKDLFLHEPSPSSPLERG